MPFSALACEPAALRGQVAMLVEKNALLEEQVRRLQEEIQDLRRQGRQQQRPTPFAGRSGAPVTATQPAPWDGSAAGGQPGHRSFTRLQVAPCQVDTHVEHWPDRCRHCDALLP